MRSDSAANLLRSLLAAVFLFWMLCACLELAHAEGHFEAYPRVLETTLATAARPIRVVDDEKEAPQRGQIKPKEDPGWRPETFGQYLEKDAADLFISPTIILALMIGILLYYFSDETKGIFKSLQSVKVGPIELVRTAIDEIKAEITEGNLNFKVNDRNIAISDFIAYPQSIGNEDVGILGLFFRVNWQKEMVRLGILEARVAVQEDRIRSSPHFDDDSPSRDYVAAKIKLFSLLVCIGNFYGFAQPDNSDPETEDMFTETALSYLQRAINLRPSLGADRADSAATLGYAYFCLAAIKGLCAHKRLSIDTERHQSHSLVRAALLDIRTAEIRGHFPPYQYHLKGLLFYDSEKFDAAAAAWNTAARDLKYPSPRMNYNAACCFSKAIKYTDALDHLETAVRLDDGSNQFLQVKEEAKKEADFEILRSMTESPPKSKSGRTFSQIIE